MERKEDNKYSIVWDYENKYLTVPFCILLGLLGIIIFVVDSILFLNEIISGGQTFILALIAITCILFSFGRFLREYI